MLRLARSARAASLSETTRIRRWTEPGSPEVTPLPNAIEQDEWERRQLDHAEGAATGDIGVKRHPRLW